MRYETLDSWRGICALLVVLYHWAGTGPLGSSPFIRGSFLFVDFFFVLSGFVMAAAYGGRLTAWPDLMPYLLRRFGRVWPLHAAVLVALVGLDASKWVLSLCLAVPFGTPAFTGFTSLATLPYNIALLHAMGFTSTLSWNPPSWSISAEFWTYVLYGIIAVALRRRARRWATVAALAIATTALLCLVTYSTEGMDTSYHLGVVRCLYGFFVGVALHAYAPKMTALRAGTQTALELMVIVAIGVYVSYCAHSPLAYTSPLVFAAAVGVYATSQGLFAQLLTKKLPRLLGTWSYSIYMTHALLLTLKSMAAKMLWAALGKILGPGASSSLHAVTTLPWMDDILSLGFAAFVVIFSAGTYRCIEDPCRRLFNQWARR